MEELLDENSTYDRGKEHFQVLRYPGTALRCRCQRRYGPDRTAEKDVAIWNINSFGEFYMQIEEKYRKDYASALDKLRTERARFAEKSWQSPGVRIFHPRQIT